MEINEYLDVFIEESKEHIQALNDHVLELEKDPENIELVNEIFRSAHTLKGMSATMGYQDLADLTHNMENVLEAVRNHQLKINTDIIDIIFNAVDALEAMVQDISAGGEGKKDVTSLVKKLDLIQNGELISDEILSQDKLIDNNMVDIQNQLDQFEVTVLQESKEKGFENYQVTVELLEDCLLKA